MDLNYQVISAVIGGVTGLITGAIASLIAPWVNWGIEKKRRALRAWSETSKTRKTSEVSLRDSFRSRFRKTLR